MNNILQSFEKADENKVFEYAVYRDSLIYLFKRHGYLCAGILASKNNAFGPPISWDMMYISMKSSVYPLPRKSTLKDFDHYRVLFTDNIANCKIYVF